MGKTNVKLLLTAAIVLVTMLGFQNCSGSFVGKRSPGGSVASEDLPLADQGQSQTGQPAPFDLGSPAAGNGDGHQGTQSAVFAAIDLERPCMVNGVADPVVAKIHLSAVGYRWIKRDCETLTTQIRIPRAEIQRIQNTIIWNDIPFRKVPNVIERFYPGDSKEIVCRTSNFSDVQLSYRASVPNAGSGIVTVYLSSTPTTYYLNGFDQVANGIYYESPLSGYGNSQMIFTLTYGDSEEVSTSGTMRFRVRVTGTSSEYEDSAATCWRWL